MGSTFSTGGDDLYDFFTIPPMPDIKVDEPTVGEEITVQTFYEGPPACKCCTNWVERLPNLVPEVAKEKYDGAAICIYNGKDHMADTLGGLKEINPRHITIQSSVIRNEIAPILEKGGMLGTPLGKHKLTIHTPFKELFFAHPQIVQLYHSHAAGSQEKKHLKLLVDVMGQLFHRTSPRVAELHEKKLIDCAHLWTIFPRGIIVYSCIAGQDHVFHVDSVDRDPTA
ncbi:hypothetical protein QBC33DRAFT_174203 [Phialemonium atrogriseum]|uniref:Uncharacterized protein n=1 Tax=Phialemonium atrogriseum TaxID=1093897 RepID=A0AAJ0FKX9_9PEZI|nr:uncharacterized protein QBC33DRAFT_174203 [Phialemonium atrogriseum]KAK1772076.1 hypothetical protein QBC33DRAFT_174203 [Phialemonium atrogriseum]